MRSEGHILDQTVSDVLGDRLPRAATVGQDASLKDAMDAMIAGEMATKVHVVDDWGRLLGTITIETVMRQVGYRLKVREPGVISFIKYLKDMLRDDATDFMGDTTPVTMDTSIVEATRLMVAEHVNDLPIVDADRRVIGELRAVLILTESRDLFDRESPGDRPSP